jgi:hypothetical protein
MEIVSDLDSYSGLMAVLIAGVVSTPAWIFAAIVLSQKRKDKKVSPWRRIGEKFGCFFGRYSLGW